MTFRIGPRGFSPGQDRTKTGQEMSMKKVYGSAQDALDGLLFDGMTIAKAGLACAAFPNS